MRQGRAPSFSLLYPGGRYSVAVMSIPSSLLYLHSLNTLNDHAVRRDKHGFMLHVLEPCSAKTAGSLHHGSSIAGLYTGTQVHVDTSLICEPVTKCIHSVECKVCVMSC